MMSLPDSQNTYREVSRFLTGNPPDEVEQIVWHQFEYIGRAAFLPEDLINE